MAQSNSSSIPTLAATLLAGTIVGVAASTLYRSRGSAESPQRIEFLKYYRRSNIERTGCFGTVSKYILKEGYVPNSKHPKNIAVKEIDFQSDKNVTREISVLKKARHVNIVDMIYFQINDRYAWIIMEYCDEDLTAFSRKHGAFTTDDMRTISFQLLKGLDFLHAYDIVHRDIKDSNVLVKFLNARRERIKDVTFKWADFGLSRELAPDCSLTIVGNRKFASPEVTLIRSTAVNDGELRGEYNGFSADVFSTGALFFYVLQQSPPFTERELMSEDPPSRDPLTSITDDNFRVVLKSMICWNPKHRRMPNDLLRLPFYSTMSEVFETPHCVQGKRVKVKKTTGNPIIKIIE